MDCESLVMSKPVLNRRNALKRMGGGLALSAAATLPSVVRGADEPQVYTARNGRIQQSVIHWCFKPMPVEELANHAARMGLKSVELVAPEYWATLKKLGLICAISPSHGFDKGFAHKEEHAECLEVLRKHIDLTSEAGFSSSFTISIIRRGILDVDGTHNLTEHVQH